jgi:protein-S-isoprenylcysteine O-methyltransferase Ste14
MSAVSAFAPFTTFGTGKRTDLSDVWIFLPGLLLIQPGLLLLPPWCDARDRWVIDGDAVRWLGLALFVAGGALRVATFFALGRRFSGLVAIQEGHTLVTGGLYRWIRHPSYAGALVNNLGWVLVFRSVAGLLVLLPLAGCSSAFCAEERAAGLGVRRADTPTPRSWRLVPAKLSATTPRGTSAPRRRTGSKAVPRAALDVHSPTERAWRSDEWPRRDRENDP